jgi:paraquat-inducible protein A
MEAAAASRRVLACHECDALMSVARDDCATFHCPRCHCVVLRRVAGGLQTALAFYVAASAFFVIANLFPIIRIEASGMAVEATLTGAGRALQAQQMTLIAVLVSFTLIVVPAIELFCTTAVLVLAESRHPFGTLAYFFRLRERLRPWNMVEIFMLGALVAIVKLRSLAGVIPGVGLWSLAGFMITHAAATHVFDPKEFWNGIERPP